ncbi:MAG: hypothetical protein L3J12_10400, partial [Spirochaetales bacterium]|nr:hypothetical protein [Spirochaetales bacterium]
FSIEPGKSVSIITLGELFLGNCVSIRGRRKAVLIPFAPFVSATRSLFFKSAEKTCDWKDVGLIKPHIFKAE